MTEFEKTGTVSDDGKKPDVAGKVMMSDELAGKLLDLVIDRIHDAKDCREFRIKYATDTPIKTISQMEEVMEAVGMSDDCVVCHMSERDMNPITALIEADPADALDVVIGLTLACAEMCPTCKMKDEGPLRLLHKSTLGRLLKEKGESVQ